MLVFFHSFQTKLNIMYLFHAVGPDFLLYLAISTGEKIELIIRIYVWICCHGNRAIGHVMQLHIV